MPTDATVPSTPDADRLAAEPATTCLNCGAVLPGRFCPDCGQPSQPLRVPVHQFVAESASEFFGIDGRVWRTLRVLLVRPGRLTVDVFQGRRRRYLSPLRVYLTATLLFFVVLTVLDPVGHVRDSLGDFVDADSTVQVAAYLAEVDSLIAAEPTRLAAEIADRQRDADSSQASTEWEDAVPGIAPADSLEPGVATARSRERVERQDQLDELIAETVRDAKGARQASAEDLARWRLEAGILGALPPDSTVRLASIYEARVQIYPESNVNIGLPDWMLRSESVQRLQEARSGQDTASAATSFAREAIGKVPTVLFLILPLFALLLKLLYVRRGWYYSEHLVFALHSHAFAFLVFTAVAVLTYLGTGSDWVGWTVTILVLAIPIYFLIAQKRVYGQGWMKTVIKSMVLGSVYTVVLVLGVVGAFLLAVAVG